ncbi:MAG: ABC transporter permease [Planctomycetes bacterium]|nr:ABC transporter permease [Planctomycetota bacterium]
MFTRLYEQIAADPINLAAAIITLIVLVAGAAYIVTYPRLFMLGLKNLRRHFLRTALTSAAIGVLAFMITTIWTIIFFIDLITVERSKDLKIIVTYRWSVPSQMPITHADYLNPASSQFLPELVDAQGNKLYGPNDFMTWSFYGGTTDPAKITPDTLILFFVMEPEQIIPMMDDLGDLDPKLVEALKDKPQGCLLGTDKLKALDKKVGERFKLTSINYKGIDLEFEIVGVLPDGRYNASAIMRMDYFNKSFEQYARANNGRAHPLANKRLNLIWLRVGDRDKFDQIGSIVMKSPRFSNFPVKVETASSLVGSFLDAYRDIFLAMKFVIVPGMLVIMALVMANAISITVRERRGEMAVMKVLGYRPNQVFLLIVGEAVFVGAVAGLLAAGATFAFFNLRWGGIPFRIGFFPVFRIPEAALMWGLAIGTLTALAGCLIPAWTARSVKVSEVFSKVA